MALTLRLTAAPPLKFALRRRILFDLRWHLTKEFRFFNKMNQFYSLWTQFAPSAASSDFSYFCFFCDICAGSLLNAKYVVLYMQKKAQVQFTLWYSFEDYKRRLKYNCL